MPTRRSASTSTRSCVRAWPSPTMRSRRWSSMEPPASTASTCSQAPRSLSTTSPRQDRRLQRSRHRHRDSAQTVAERRTARSARRSGPTYSGEGLSRRSTAGAGSAGAGSKARKNRSGNGARAAGSRFQSYRAPTRPDPDAPGQGSALIEVLPKAAGKSFPSALGQLPPVAAVLLDTVRISRALRISLRATLRLTRTPRLTIRGRTGDRRLVNSMGVGPKSSKNSASSNPDRDAAELHAGHHRRWCHWRRLDENALDTTTIKRSVPSPAGAIRWR